MGRRSTWEYFNKSPNLWNLTSGGRVDWGLRRAVIREGELVRHVLGKTDSFIFDYIPENSDIWWWLEKKCLNFTQLFPSYKYECNTVYWLLRWHSGKESACNAGNLGLIPGLGRSPGEENGYPLQYSCLENSMDREIWWATVHEVSKSQPWLSS